jgi:hypothetical protein
MPSSDSGGEHWLKVLILNEFLGTSVTGWRRWQIRRQDPARQEKSAKPFDGLQPAEQTVSLKNKIVIGSP